MGQSYLEAARDIDMVPMKVDTSTICAGGVVGGHAAATSAPPPPALSAIQESLWRIEEAAQRIQCRLEDFACFFYRP
jgi:hypothetical protein